MALEAGLRCLRDSPRLHGAMKPNHLRPKSRGPARFFLSAMAPLAFAVPGRLALAQGFTLLPEIPPLVAGAANENFGWAVGNIGDVTGDGKNDFAVGAPGANGVAGLVRVFSGADGSLLYTVNGDANSRMGQAIAGLNDIDGDGVPDFVVGAMGLNSLAGPQGYASIRSGVDGQEIRRFTSGNNLANFGRAVANVGDLDGDGKDDVLVGGPGGTNNFAGLARVFSSGTGDLLGVYSGSHFDSFGRAVSSAGDVNNDGIPDYAIGAPGKDASDTVLNVGRVEIYSGADGSLLRFLQGKVHLEELGHSLAYVGMLDPLTPGLAIGAIRFNNAAGRVSLHDARTLKPLVVAPSLVAGGFLGLSVAALGDVNGDGIPDFAGGAQGPNPPATGSVHVFSGKKGPGKALAILENDMGQGLGLGVAGLGDVNGDGLPEILVGAWSGSDGGNARVYSMAGLYGANVKGAIQFKIALQRPEGAPDPDAQGLLTGSYTWKQQTFAVQVQKLELEIGGQLGVFLETGKGTGVFGEVAQLTPAKGGKWSVKLASGGVPPQLNLMTLAQLEGRIVEVRDANGAVYLTAVLPKLSGFFNFQSTAQLLPDVPGSGKPSGTCKIGFKATTGVSVIDVKTKLLPVGPTYEAFIEDAVGSRSFVSLGPLVKGALKIDTKTGKGLPGLVSTVAELASREVEIRDGATVVLSGSLP